MPFEIKIPFKTPTVNHLYGRRMNQSRPYLKPEAKKLREEIKEKIFEFPFHEKELFNKRLRVTTSIHENWLTKKGEVKRKDIANREKFLIDTVFEALALDDKFIFEHNLVKVQDYEHEFAMIKIEVIR